MSGQFATDLIGKRVEVKQRGDSGSYWTDTRDSGCDPIIGIVRTVSVAHDGVIIYHIEDADRWLHVRSSQSHTFRLHKAMTFAELPLNATFKLVNPPEGWAPCKLVKLKRAPGWAMPEGWNYIRVDDEGVQGLEVEPLNEPPPEIGGSAPG